MSCSDKKEEWHPRRPRERVSCPRCNGTGRAIKSVGYLGLSKSTRCSRCGGTGLVPGEKFNPDHSFQWPK